LHISSKYLGKPSRDVVGVNDRISVCLQSCATVVITAIGATIFALVPIPGVLDALEPNVPIVAGERFGDGVFAGSVF